MPPKSSFVLDTSALLALRGDEPGADRVEALLIQGQKTQCRLLVSFMSRMEILYLVRREEGEEASSQALLLIDSFPVEWITCEPRILEIAARIKARGKLSVADCWVGATAIAYGATLVHKDPEFEPLKEIPQEALK
jgi:predicted nucleic acid-binding protein